MANIRSMNKMDIFCPNFDHYLELKLENIMPHQIALLENSVQHKIIRYKSKSVGHMSLAEKMHTLSVGLSAQVVLSVCDEENGITADLFKTAIKSQAGKLKNSQMLDHLDREGIFIQTDKQVAQALVYMSHAQTSDIYNLIRMNNIRDKGQREIKFDKKKQVMNGLVDYLVKYESRKRRVLEQFGINIPKFYGLLYFYLGDDLCRNFYDKQFKYAYSKSRTDLSKGLAELYRNGCLSKRGVTRELKYSITSKGIDLLMKVLSKMLYDL